MGFVSLHEVFVLNHFTVCKHWPLAFIKSNPSPTKCLSTLIYFMAHIVFLEILFILKLFIYREF